LISKIHGSFVSITAMVVTSVEEGATLMPSASVIKKIREPAINQRLLEGL
jgi:hypothetical protein